MAGNVTTIAALRSLSGATDSVLYLEGYYSLADGGEGMFVYNSGDTTSADNGGTIIVDAASRRWYRDYTGAVSVRWFGAKGDGSTNDYSAISTALSLTTGVYFPAGNYVVGSTLNISIGGANIYGDASSNTSITSNQTNIPVITCTNGISNFAISNLTIDRSATPASGGDGIQLLNPNNTGSITNVACQNHWNGFTLGVMNAGYVTNCVAQNNANHGFNITPGALNAGPCQWNPTGCSAGRNSGDGFHIANTSYSGELSISTMIDCITYANTGHGVGAYGSSGSMTVAAVRIEGGFFGEDNTDIIYLDTYDAGHVIRATYIELAGASYTGRNSNNATHTGTAPSNTGAGINITANNSSATIACGVINGNAYDGIVVQGGRVAITGGEITNNGLNASGPTGRQNGILVSQSGSSVKAVAITGSVITDTGAGTQKYGINTNCDLLAVAGCFCNGNITAAVSVPAGFGTVSSIAGCVPRSMNV